MSRSAKYPAGKTHPNEGVKNIPKHEGQNLQNDQTTGRFWGVLIFKKKGSPSAEIMGYIQLWSSPKIADAEIHVKTFRLHPGRLTWNLQITHLERKIIFQTSMIMFHVNLPGCIPGIPTSIKTMGVNITTFAYLRVFFLIEIGSTILLMVVEAQGYWTIRFPNFFGGDVPYRPLANSRFTNPECCSVQVSSWLMDITLAVT